MPGAALIGIWRVDGVEGDLWVRFSPREVEVLQDGRSLYGSWRTGDDQLVVSVTGFEGGIEDREVAWLADAATFAADGEGWALRSASGDLLATLRPGDGATPPADDPAFAEAPTIAPEDLPLLQQPAPVTPLPDPPLVPEDLVGTWSTGEAGDDGTRPSLAFAADGTYAGSDGCNGIGGAWRLLPQGRVLLTSGLSTLRACENMLPVQRWIDEVRTIRLDADALTLLDADGEPLRTLER